MRTTRVSVNDWSEFNVFVFGNGKLNLADVPDRYKDYIPEWQEFIDLHTEESKHSCILRVSFHMQVNGYAYLSIYDYSGVSNMNDLAKMMTPPAHPSEPLPFDGPIQDTDYPSTGEQ